MVGSPSSVRLTGAKVLRKDLLAAADVTLAGRLFGGPGDEVIDLSGYLLMPGIVDLCDSRHMDDGMIAPDRQSQVEAGIATAYRAVYWDGDPEGLVRQDASDPALLTHLFVDTYAVETLPALTHSLAARHVDLLTFVHGGDPRWEGLSAPLRDFPTRAIHHAERSRVPRFLLRVAEACDEMGVPYGSFGDFDGETLGLVEGETLGLRDGDADGLRDGEKIGEAQV